MPTSSVRGSTSPTRRLPGHEHGVPGILSRDPPARATVKALLTSSDYRVEITMVAVRSANRTAVTTPAADGTPGAKNANLSSAIRVGNRLYLSGILGNTADEQRRREGADEGGADANRPHARGGRLRLERRRRQRGVSARPRTVRRYERVLPGAVPNRLPRARDGRRRPDGGRRRGRDHVHGREVATVGNNHAL